MFENNPNWFYYPPTESYPYGQWWRVGGRTEEERARTRKMYEEMVK